MKLEDQVCSLEHAKKLKELGAKQESYFAYVNTEQGGEPHLLRPLQPFTGGENYVSAFTVAELGEMLPKDIPAEVLNKRFPFEASRVAAKDDEDMLQSEENILDEVKSVFNELYDYDEYENGFAYGIRLNYGRGLKLSYFFNSEEWECNYQVFEVEGATEADARAKMLIYLLENNLITI